MSVQHPIIAVTGSSGAGTSSVRLAFDHIFQRAGIKSAMVQGDSFHRYDRESMQEEVLRARAAGRALTHFGPDGNLFKEMEVLFREYGRKGSGYRRWYIHNEEEAEIHGLPPGRITDWEPLEEDTDVLLYEGLHGGLVTDQIDIASHVDLLIGVVPIINLEWTQKIHRDQSVRGYSAEAATSMILSRMHDYVHYITPQFSRTDINFQRVPTVDTSNPFAATEIPTDDESFYVVHFRNTEKLQPDFRYLLEMLKDSFMSSPDTIVIPAGKKPFAMEIILRPVIERMIAARG